MVERDDEAIARGVAHVTKVYDGLVAKGRLTEAQKAATLAGLHAHHPLRRRGGARGPGDRGRVRGHGRQGKPCSASSTP